MRNKPEFNSEDFLQEGMDGKRLALCLWRKWKSFAAAAIAGAVLAVAAYLLVMQIQNGETVYTGLSHYYIYYNTDEMGNVKDHFNAYTWNDWLKADVMMEYVMPQLPGLSEEEVKASVRAECPSNSSWMYVYVENTDADKVSRIGEAYVSALSDFAKNQLGLDGIDRWNQEPVQVKAVEYRTLRAGVSGAAAGFLLAVFFFAYVYVMDDALYLAEDVKRRLGLPLLGFRMADGDSFDVLEQEQREAMAYLEGKAGEPAEEILAERNYSAEELEALRRKKLLVLTISWGTAGGRWAKHRLEELAVQEIRPCGVILTRSSGRFLRRYYGRRRERK